MEELYLFENNIDIEEVKYKFIEALTKSKIYQNEFVVENLIIEAKYEANVVKLVDYFLELGKEILILPGDVWDKNCYFSTFLIKEGANVVLNINDINLYL